MITLSSLFLLRKENKNGAAGRGFTLIELIIVIAIIGILAATVVLVLNPLEILRQARDAQRISDLATVKSAISLYVSTVTTPDMDGSASATCVDEASTAVYVSIPSGTSVADLYGVGVAESQVAATNLGLVNGNGWIPVDLTATTGGAPISNYPVDPLNETDGSADAGTPSGSDHYYQYFCNSSSASSNPSTFRLITILESTKHTTTEDTDGKDGGLCAAYYEVGTNLQLDPGTDCEF